ncbi:MAG: site-specific integrase [Thermoleophilia bacterium]|nr:site-specific integrase [Thermoleophilia bacterium]
MARTPCAECQIALLEGLATYGTRLAAAGVRMRMLQEWMGHRDYRTTLVYADYEPGDDESAIVDEAFSWVAPTS